MRPGHQGAGREPRASPCTLAHLLAHSLALTHSVLHSPPPPPGLTLCSSLPAGCLVSPSCHLGGGEGGETRNAAPTSHLLSASCLLIRPLSVKGSRLLGIAAQAGPGRGAWRLSAGWALALGRRPGPAGRGALGGRGERSHVPTSGWGRRTPDETGCWAEARDWGTGIGGGGGDRDAGPTDGRGEPSQLLFRSGFSQSLGGWGRGSPQNQQLVTALISAKHLGNVGPMGAHLPLRAQGDS